MATDRGPARRIPPISAPNGGIDITFAGLRPREMLRLVEFAGTVTEAQ
jgi:hypothetical protein